MAPWELSAQPSYWRDCALIRRQVDADAADYQARRAQRRSHA